jgi:anaerobic sulfite reductase subunit C
VNTKELKKNAWRVTKHRGKTALRVRVPGGHLDTKHLNLVQEIANEYGNGTLHLTARQGFEVPDIDMAFVPEINKKIQPLLAMLDIHFKHPENGYPAAGTRNISACIGNRVCPFANDDTTALAKELEKSTFPNDLHFKIAVTGCPNDCIKAHMQDFGILCLTEPQYDESRCINCQACVRTCRNRVTEALKAVDFRIERSEDLCIGCGECILKCPTRAMTRSDTNYYRMVIMGRTGKKNPRLARTFLEWADWNTCSAVIKNAYSYVDKYIDRSLPKEHVGYIVDRTGYPVFRDYVLDGVQLNPKTKVAEHVQFGGYTYRRDIHFNQGG